MVRLILMTDFSESFSYRLLTGILDYSKAHEPWVVCRMPRSYKDRFGLTGVLKWAKRWEADAIIAQFDPFDDVSIFAKNGIIAIAQDYREKFSTIPNITSDYIKTGKMAAEFFLNKGYKNFAFYGYENTIWSQERCEGFRQTIEEKGYIEKFFEYQKQPLENLWSYDSVHLLEWIKSLPMNTALFCCDDTQGNRISEVCLVNGIRVPQDIAILGVDNDDIICNLSQPALSSVNLNIRRGGFEAAKLIDDIINNNSSVYDIVIQPTFLINRKSTDIYSTEDKVVLKALQIIHDNLNKKISVDFIVSQVPLSRRLLEKRFKQSIGTSIYQYIFNQRIEKLAHLLLQTNHSVADLALEVGFQDMSNVSRQFKLLKGCTPTQYRKKHFIMNG